MAPKKQNTGKGKAVAGSSGGAVEEPVQSRNPRRSRADMQRDEQTAWRDGMEARKVKNERHIALGPGWPAGFGAIAALQRQGMQYWFEPNPGYNRALVIEFYKNMVVPETILTPGARITSSIGRNNVFVDVDKIAAVMSYIRPQGEVNFPATEENPITPEDVAYELYEHSRDYKIPHVPGKLTPTYRVLNQIVCYNLYPRGTENKPQERVGKTMWALGQEDTVCDWALFIFAEMVDMRAAPKSARLPFPCLLTRMFHAEGIQARPYAKLECLDLGTIGSDFLARSTGQVRSAGQPLLVQPPKEASLKTWLRKIFCQNTAIIKSQQKMKKEHREMVRRQHEMHHELRYVRQRMTGESSAPYVPPQLPEVEVSDDFAEEFTEEESDGHDQDEE